jgi:hypothetical protein
MSIQQNFPAISPSLSLNLARSKTLDPRITFTRTSSGTRTNSQGLVEVVSANTPRFDHSYNPVSGTMRSLGLLVEESRTNFVRFSGRPDVNWILDVSGGNGLSFIDGEIVTSSSGGLSATYVAELSTSNQIITKFSSGFPAGVLTGATSGATRNITSQLSPGGASNVSVVLTNEVLSPDGTQNALLVTPTTTGTQLRLISKTYTTSTAGTYTFSVFFKNKNISNNTVAIRLSNQDATAHVRLNFNFSTKTFGGVENSGLGGWTGSAGYEDYQNDWIRIWVTATTTPDSHTFISGNFWLGGYQGTTETAGSMYVWESQIETGAFPTSQIKTTFSAVTRTADNVSMVGDNFSDWYNQSEGTVYADTRMVGVQTGRYDRLWAITNSNLNLEGISVFVAGPAGTPSGYVSSITITNSATEQVSGTIVETALTTPQLKSAFAFKQNDCASSYNGQQRFVDNIVDLSTFTTPPDRLLIGQPQRFQGYSCMTVSQLTYYPRRLTNTQLQNLTR